MAAGVDAGDRLLLGRLVPLLDEDVRAAGDVVGEVRSHQRLLRRAAADLARRYRHAGRHLRDAVTAVEGDEGRADAAEGRVGAALGDAALDLGDRFQEHRWYLAGHRRAGLTRPDLEVGQAEVGVAGEEEVERCELDGVEEEAAGLGGPRRWLA